MEPQTKIDSAPRRTALGSPCSPAWDDAHIARVEAEETKLGTRICGARTLSGGACALPPNHDNGRCKFHGGFDLTGGQPGNRNAVIHGLYSRCVQTCGDQCPMWKTCPCAGPEVLKVSPPERPRCPYETVEYNTALTDTLTKLDRHQQEDPALRHTAHHVAMLQVMLLRAAAAMAVNPFVDNSVLSTGNYHRTNRKESPYLLAFMRITRELRRTLKQLEPGSARLATVPERHAHLHRTRYDASLLPEDQGKTSAPVRREMIDTYRKLEKATSKSHYSTKKECITLLSEAFAHDKNYAAALLDSTSPFYEERFERLIPYVNTS